MNRLFPILFSSLVFISLSGAFATESTPPTEPPSTPGGSIIVPSQELSATDTDESSDAPAPTSVAEVLASTIARFPTDAFSFSGAIILRKQAGVIVREIPFQARLHWGEQPATATYTLFDSFGRALNTMQISREANGKMDALYLDSDGAPLPTPPLTAAVAGTDITWLDITLSYLWWQEGSLHGTESFKGALCDIIEMRPPQPIPGCAAVRLWVDRKRGFMRQAAQIDENGERIRWMWVSSVGKINDRWMIKNLEVKRPGTGMQTKLHIDDLEPL